MSISDGRLNRFDDWLSAEYARRGDFTLLVVLASVEGTAIDLLSSTFMHVVGDEAR